VAIGRRALGHRIRRRTAPPRPHQSDVAEHRTAQARPDAPRREETRHPGTGAPTRSACRPGRRKRATRRPNTVRGRPPGRAQLPPGVEGR
jgi:hypothetical protein